MVYELPNNRKGRSDIKKIGRKMVAYAADNSVRAIIFLDGAARRGSQVFKSAWDQEQPGIQMPQRYFLNPNALKRSSIEYFLEEFNEKYKGLVAIRDHPVLVFDTCIHTGRTIESVMELLEKSGFSNVHIGLAQPADRSYKGPVVPDFTGLNRKAHERCYPFDFSISIEDRLNSLLSYSRSSQNPSARRKKAKKELDRLFRKRKTLISLLGLQ